MVAAPTATVAATTCMMAATAMAIAPMCAQALLDASSFGSACIVGNWDKVTKDFDCFTNFLQKEETVGRFAELAAGIATPTPNLNHMVDQILSLRPVITAVHKASDQATRSLYLMTKSQLEKVWQQSIELLQLPEFTNFNASYKNILGCNFFDILPQSHPALAPAFTNLTDNFLTSYESTALSQLFFNKNSPAADAIKSVIATTQSSLSNQIPAQAAEETRAAIQLESFGQTTDLHESLQQEITQASQLKPPINLSTEICSKRAYELADLSTGIRQLQDLSKITDNFTNLDNLIPEDILYLNRIYELQEYRSQIKNFLETHKPYFTHDGNTYFIENISSYHIHAGDYFIKKRPKGGHSNYGGQKLDYLNPELIKNGPLNTKKVSLSNSRIKNKTKASSLYSESWSELKCDFKAIEVITSNKSSISTNNTGTLKIKGLTSENLEIIIYYDIKNKRIKTHYPNII